MAKRDDSGEETVTLTREQFNELLATRGQEGGLTESAIDRLIAGMSKLQPPGPYDANLTKAQQAALRAPPSRGGYKVVDLVGESGSKAKGWCKRGPNGEHLLVSIVPGTYEYPKNLLKFQKDGGLCPDGMPIARDTQSGMLIATAGDRPLSDLIEFLSYPCMCWALDLTIRHDMSDRGWARPSGLRRSDVASAACFDSPWDDQEPQPIAAE